MIYPYHLVLGAYIYLLIYSWPCHSRSPTRWVVGRTWGDELEEKLMVCIDVRSCVSACSIIAALVVTQSACGSTDAPSAPSVSTERSSAGEPAPSPSPAPAPAPAPTPSPTPAPAPAQVSVSGSVRDALNGGNVGWGMIERFQEGNPSGEKRSQSPGGNCYKCSWSNDRPKTETSRFR
jgi:hypothetical protein